MCFCAPESQCGFPPFSLRCVDGTVFSVAMAAGGEVRNWVIRCGCGLCYAFFDWDTWRRIQFIGMVALLMYCLFLTKLLDQIWTFYFWLDPGT